MTFREKDNAGVQFPPPIFVAMWLGLGLFLDYERGSNFPISASLRLLLAGVVLTMAIALSIFAFRGFVQFQTSIKPNKPSTALMQNGIYGLSRNPIYMAFLLIYLGISLLANAPVTLLFLPIVFLWLRYSVIAKEEAYLLRRFGESYENYRSQTRRWI